MLGLACLAGFAAGKNMIPGEYAISNPNRLVKARFTGEFSDEYFEVYSPPIKSQLRSEVNSELNFSPNFEGLVLGCIDADFCK